MSKKKTKQTEASKEPKATTEESQKPPKCFVMMPISDQGDYPPGHFGRVYRHLIKPACELAGVEPYRADDVKNTNIILIDILRKIVDYPIAICDLPKTRTIGKFARLAPILDEVKPYLVEARKRAVADEVYVFPTIRKDANPGTMAKKIVKRAGQTPWKNFFNSLRATAETDLMDKYGLRRACQWAGNSPTTAMRTMRTYALVKNTDFDDDQMGQNAVIKSDAKSNAIFDVDAKSDSAPASTRVQNTTKNAPKGVQNP